MFRLDAVVSPIHSPSITGDGEAMLLRRWRRFWMTMGHRRRVALLCGIVLSMFALFRFGIFNNRGDDHWPQSDHRRILEELDTGLVREPHMADSKHREQSIVADSRNSAERRQSAPSPNDPTVILVMAADRPEAIHNHLQQLTRLRPSATAFPLIISQDGTNAEVTEKIMLFVNESEHISFIHHAERKGIHHPDYKTIKNYLLIAEHYKWALDKVFIEKGYSTAIITEDDLDVAEDFYSYFASTRYLLFADSTIWCISAWNDNGSPSLTDRARSERLYRTDFFPGLGWMLRAELWKELSAKWPLAYWDDWMRTQEVRQERVCIRPEVSRTAHNMRVAGKGSSNAMYKSYLSSIRLPDTPIDFSLIDLDYVKKKNYDHQLHQKLQEARPVNVTELETAEFSENSVRFVYSTPREYRDLARKFNLMTDIRSGMPRTAYHGVLTFWHSTARVYALSPYVDIAKPLSDYPSSSVYNTTWDLMTRYLDFQELYCRPSRFTGTCDPKNPEMIAWFVKKGQSKRLRDWGNMIVN